MDSGRLLGLRGCYNRPQGIWELQLPDLSRQNSPMELTVTAKLGAEDRSGRCPQLTPSGSSVTWISNQVGDAHSSCTALHLMSLSSGKIETLVNIVWEPLHKGGFPGLYEPAITSQGFTSISGEPWLVTSSYWGSRSTVLLISMGDGEAKEITPVDSSQFSWTFMAAHDNGRIVCARSSCTPPSEVVLGCISNDFTVSWTVLWNPELRLERAFSDLFAMHVTEGENMYQSCSSYLN